jgi:hypothetical protein
MEERSLPNITANAKRAVKGRSSSRPMLSHLVNTRALLLTFIKAAALAAAI